MLLAKEIFSDKFRLVEIRKKEKKKKSLLVFVGITIEGILGKKIKSI
jgi:hypothetical protein